MQVMVIAPGREIYRTWLDLDPLPLAVCWSERSGDLSGLEDDLSDRIMTAAIHRVYAPGWRVVLMFAMGEAIPMGYVMPGWVQGEHVEEVEVCTACYGHLAWASGQPGEHANIRRRIDRAYCVRLGRP